MPASGARDTIVLWIMGVSAWSRLFLVMRLGSERTVLVVVLAPTAVFLGAMVILMQLSEADRPDSIQPIAETAAEREGDADRG